MLDEKCEQKEGGLQEGDALVGKYMKEKSLL